MNYFEYLSFSWPVIPELVSRFSDHSICEQVLGSSVRSYLLCRTTAPQDHFGSYAQYGLLIHQRDISTINLPLHACPVIIMMTSIHGALVLLQSSDLLLHNLNCPLKILFLNFPFFHFHFKIFHFTPSSPLVSVGCHSPQFLSFTNRLTTAIRVFCDGGMSSQIVKSRRKRNICDDMWSLKCRRD